MLDVKDKSILKYVSDYKLNLIVPEEIEDFDKFKTEMGPLMEFISSASSGKKFTNVFETKRTMWENLSCEAIDLLNICLDAKLKVEKDLEKGVGNVCKGLEEFWEIAREEGREEGTLLTLLQLVRDGLLDVSVGIERSGISEAEFKEKLNRLA